MITLPKPKFAETNVPLGLSPEKKKHLIKMQAHSILNAIDRVSHVNGDACC